MAGKFLSPQEAERLMGLAALGTPPHKIIADLKTEIAGATRVLELRASTGTKPTTSQINEIVQMKKDLDSLYGMWVKGQLK
ncbi:MAG: hypothetical protein ABIH21_05235 [Patescibacteria group bacterium]